MGSAIDPPDQLSHDRFPGPVTYLAVGTASLIGGTGAALDPLLSTSLRASLGLALGVGAGLSYYLALRAPLPALAKPAAAVAPAREPPKVAAPSPRSVRPETPPITARPQRIARVPALTAPRPSFARAGAIAAPAAPSPVPTPLPQSPPRAPPREPEWARAIPPLPPAPSFTLVAHDEIWEDSLPDMAYWGSQTAASMPRGAPVAAPLAAPAVAAARVEPIPRSVARPVNTRAVGTDPVAPIPYSSSGGFIQRVGAATPPTIADAPCAECGRGAGNPVATPRCPRCARPLCKGCASRFERAPAEVPCYHQLGSLS